MGTERARGGSSSISTREARRNTRTQQQHTGKKMPAAMKMRTARPARSAKKVATRGRTARAVSTNACMLVWKPRIQFETFSYLPPLADDDIKKQIAYMLRKGLTPCLEFDCAERSFAKEQPADGPGFYYNRYWMMWKLPMFGCPAGDQVLAEVANCKKEYPDHYIRVVGFNAEKQVQMASFIVNKRRLTYVQKWGPKRPGRL